VVVLAEGRMVERGTHADLLAAGGRYAGLWWEERMHDRPDDRLPEDQRPDPDPDGPSHSYTEGSESP
jgi:hypothetical protein